MNIFSALQYLKKTSRDITDLVERAPITTLTTTATVNTYESRIEVTTGSPWTLTLYTAVGNRGKKIEIIKTSSDTNKLTVAPNGAETINGASEESLYFQYETLVLISDGANWLILDRQNHLAKPAKTLANTTAVMTANNTRYFIGYTAADFDPHSNFVNLGSAENVSATDTTYYQNNRPGKFYVTGAVFLNDSDMDAAEYYEITINKNGSAVARRIKYMEGSPASAGETVIVTCILDLSANSYISMAGDHNCNCAISIVANAGYSWLAIHQISL